MGLGLDKNPAHRTETSLIANEPIAAMLREMADLLEQQEADGFRIAAYRRAAQTIDALEMPVEELARKGGLQALDELPGIGWGLRPPSRKC
jgi:DNA polymerase/3'-5' exonuclease PolX